MGKQNWRKRHAAALSASLDLEAIDDTKIALDAMRNGTYVHDIDDAVVRDDKSLSDILHEIDAAGGPGPNFHYDGGMSRLREKVDVESGKIG